jgi:hypothetical protein
MLVKPEFRAEQIVQLYVSMLGVIMKWIDLALALPMIVSIVAALRVGSGRPVLGLAARDS